jgi:hypothetical protein
MMWLGWCVSLVMFAMVLVLAFMTPTANTPIAFLVGPEDAVILYCDTNDVPKMKLTKGF